MKVLIKEYEKFFPKKIIITEKTKIGRYSNKMFNYDFISRNIGDYGWFEISFTEGKVCYKHIQDNNTQIYHLHDDFNTCTNVEKDDVVFLEDRDVIKILNLKYEVRIYK